MVDRLCQRALPRQCPLHARPKLAPPRPQDIVIGRDGHFPCVVDALMIAQIPADIGVVHQDRNPIPLQNFGRPDPRELQQLRRVDGTAGQNNLAPRQQNFGLTTLKVFDPHGPPILDHDFRHHGLGQNAQVLASFGRAQKCTGGRVSPRTTDRHLINARALLISAVEIGIGAQPSLGTCLQIRRHQRMQSALIGRNEQRATLAAKRIFARFVIFDRTIGGQDIVPPPSAHGFAPVVIILGLSPDPNHGIDRR